MNPPPADLQHGIEGALAAMGEARRDFTPPLAKREIGTILSISEGIATVSGLPGVGFEELVTFPGDVAGIVFNVDEDELGVVLLGEYDHLRAGDEVERTGRVLDTPVGDALIGRVIDPLGRALDDQTPLVTSERLPIERPAPPIMDRAPVTVPLQTGIKVIDALIPIGRGQRELIVGDRQTGKTAIAMDAILNQRDQNVLCIYCAIGQRTSSVAKVVAHLKEAGALAYTIVVVAEGSDVAGLSYVAPYAATSIAEHFMAKGRDVLIVYDDLTAHARAYREVSLLLRRSPGREAFPGDIFYIHSRLLERATHLRPEIGGGSITALPIIETESQNISAYIPTNLISITDGQIYLSPALFELGQLPAVDVGKSVSRVGGKAQRSAYHDISGNLKLAYAQFTELETFARFGTRLDDATRKTIAHGERIRPCLSQAQSDPMTAAEQIMVLVALVSGFFDTVPIPKMAEAQQAVRKSVAAVPQSILERIQTSEKWQDADRAAFLAQATLALAPFINNPDKSRP
jgi:F-type H+-transporting ATPase subunit alpha